jgi:hypothetical protein
VAASHPPLPTASTEKFGWIASFARGSGDKDLLAMAERYPIVAPATFWATHSGL